MSLDGAQLTYINADGVAVAHAVKGCKFSVGSSLACNLILHSADRLHCEIQCDAFGRVTIYNHSTNEPIHLNDQIVVSTRPLLDGARIKIKNENYTWVFPRDGETITPDRNLPRPESSSASGSRQRRHFDNRLTFHNFRHSINFDDEGNTSIESREPKAASFSSAADATNASSETNCSFTTPADELDGTIPKVDLLEGTQNKENTSTPSNKLMLQLCARSDLVITSFSPHVTDIKSEKSFTRILKPSTACILSPTTTPRSVYNTPKSVLSELNDDSCSRELLEFSTPSTSKESVAAKCKTSMYLIDLTTPQKERQSLGTPGSAHIITVDSTDESGSDASIIDITRDTPGKQQPMSLKTPKEQLLAASSTPKRTPQSLMKRAILTSAKNQIATACRTPNNSQHSLMNARRQCFTAPRRLPFHPQPKWRTPSRLQIPTLPGKEVHISLRKRQSTSLCSPRDTKVSSMRKSLAAVKTNPNVNISNKLVAKARRALNSPKDLKSPQRIDSPKLQQQPHFSASESSTQADENNSSAELNQMFTIDNAMDTIAGKVTEEYTDVCQSDVNKLHEKSLDKVQSKELKVNKSIPGGTGKSEESCEFKEDSIRPTLIRIFDTNISPKKTICPIDTNAQFLKDSKKFSTIEAKKDILTSKETSISVSDETLSLNDKSNVHVETSDQDLLVDSAQSNCASVVVIEDYICEEVPTSTISADEAEAALKEEEVHLLEETICEELPTNEENTPTASCNTVSVDHEDVAPPGETPIPRRSSRRISIEQSLTPRRSTRLASVDAAKKLEPITKPTRRASYSAFMDSQRNDALATPKRKLRLTEDAQTLTRKSQRLRNNTPQRTFHLDESVGDMGVIVEEEADKLPTVTDGTEFGIELPTVDVDEPDKIDYQGMRELLKTPKSCSTPHFKGLREMLRTPKMQSSLLLDNIEELLEADSNDATSTTPKKQITVGLASLELTHAETMNDVQDLYFKTPRGKNLMIPNEPASAVLKTDNGSMLTKTEYDLNATNATLHLDKIFDDVLTEDTPDPVIAINDSESEMNVSATGTVGDVPDDDPLSTTVMSAVAPDDTVASEALMNIDEIEKSHRDPLTSTAFKSENKTELKDECYAEQTKSPGICEVSGIQMLDQTTDSMFSEPLMVSGVDSFDVTVNETKATTRIVNVTSQTPTRTALHNTFDTDSTIGLTEPLLLSDDEEDLDVLSSQSQTIESKAYEESTIFELDLSTGSHNIEKSITLNDVSNVGNILESPSVQNEESDLSITNKPEVDIDLETSAYVAATDESLSSITVRQIEGSKFKGELESTTKNVVEQNAGIVDESSVLQATENAKEQLSDSNQLDKPKETQPTTDTDLTIQIENTIRIKPSDKANDSASPKGTAETESTEVHQSPRDNLKSAETCVNQSTIEVNTEQKESVAELNTLDEELQSGNEPLTDNLIEAWTDADISAVYDLALEDDASVLTENQNSLSYSVIKPQSDAKSSNVTKIPDDQCVVLKNASLAADVALPENSDHHQQESVRSVTWTDNESLQHKKNEDSNKLNNFAKETSQVAESKENYSIVEIDDEAEDVMDLTEPDQNESEVVVETAKMNESVIDHDEIALDVESKNISKSADKSLFERRSSTKAEINTPEDSLNESVEIIDSLDEVIPTTSIIALDELDEDVESKILSTSPHKSLLGDDNASNTGEAPYDSIGEPVEVVDSSDASNEVVPVFSGKSSLEPVKKDDSVMEDDICDIKNITMTSPSTAPPINEDTNQSETPVQETSQQPESNKNNYIYEIHDESERMKVTAKAKESKSSIIDIAVEAFAAVSNINESIINQNVLNQEVDIKLSLLDDNSKTDIDISDNNISEVIEVIDSSEASIEDNPIFFEKSTDKSCLDNNSKVVAPEDIISKSMEVLDSSCEQSYLETIKKNETVLKVDASRVPETGKKDYQANVQNTISMMKNDEPAKNENTNEILTNLNLGQSTSRLNHLREMETNAKIEQSNVQEANSSQTCIKETTNIEDFSSSDVLGDSLVDQKVEIIVTPASPQETSSEAKETAQLTETITRDVDEESKITQESAKIEVENIFKSDVEMINSEQSQLNLVDSSAAEPNSLNEQLDAIKTVNIPTTSENTKTDMEATDVDIPEATDQITEIPAKKSIIEDINEDNASMEPASADDLDTASLANTDKKNMDPNVAQPEKTDINEVQADVETPKVQPVILELNDSSSEEIDKIRELTEPKSSVEIVEGNTKVQTNVESATADDSVLELNISCVSKSDKKDDHHEEPKPDVAEELNVADINEVQIEKETTRTEESVLHLDSSSVAVTEPEIQTETIASQSDDGNSETDVKSPHVQVNVETAPNASVKTDTDKEKEPQTSVVTLAMEDVTNPSIVEKSAAEADISLEDKQGTAKRTIDDRVENEIQVRDAIEARLVLNVSEEKSAGESLILAKYDKTVGSKLDQFSESSLTLTTTEEKEKLKNNSSEKLVVVQASEEHKTEFDFAVSRSQSEDQARQPEKDAQIHLAQSDDDKKATEQDDDTKVAVIRKEEDKSEETQIELNSSKDASNNIENYLVHIKPSEPTGKPKEKTSVSSPVESLDENNLKSDKLDQFENTTRNVDQVVSEKVDIKVEQKTVSKANKITSEGQQKIAFENLTISTMEQKQQKSSRRGRTPSKQITKSALHHIETEVQIESNDVPETLEVKTRVQNKIKSDVAKVDEIKSEELPEAEVPKERMMPVEKDTKMPRRGRKPSAEIVTNEIERPKRRVRQPTTETDEGITHDEKNLDEIVDEPKPKRQERKPSTDVRKAVADEIVKPMAKEISKRHIRKASTDSVEEVKLPQIKSARTKRKPSAQTIEVQLLSKEHLARISESVEYADLLPHKEPAKTDSVISVQESPVSPLAVNNVPVAQQIEEPTVSNAENKTKRGGRKVTKLVDEPAARQAQDEVAKASGSREKSVTRRGRKATTDEDVQIVQLVEKTNTPEDKPKRRGRKVSIYLEVDQPTQPQIPEVKEIQAGSPAQEKSAPRRGRRKAAETNLASTELPQFPVQEPEIVEAAESRVKTATKRGRKATTDANEPVAQPLKEPVNPDVDTKVKRRVRKRSISVEVVQQPALAIEASRSNITKRFCKTIDDGDVPPDSTELKPKRRGRKLNVEAQTEQQQPQASVKEPTQNAQNPSVEVELPEADAVRKLVIRPRQPSIAVETTKEELAQPKKTTTRRARKVSLSTDELDKKLNVQVLQLEPNAVLVSPRAQPANLEDELQPRRREGRNLPRKNYTETADDDKLGSARRARKPAVSKLAVSKPAQAEAAAELTPAIPPVAKLPVEPVEPKTPVNQAIELPEQTTSQRREGRNMPRKNYVETSDDEKPISSRGRRARKPTTKGMETVVSTATLDRRKGKLVTDADPEEPAEKKIVTEVISPIVTGKARGAARRKVNVADDFPESETPEPSSSKRGARNRKDDLVDEKTEQKQPVKRKVKAIEETLDEQPTMKKVRGARAKTPAIIETVKIEHQEEPTTKPSTAGTRRGRPLRTVKVEAEVELMPDLPSATTTRTGRGRKVHFEPAEDATTAAKHKQLAAAEAEPTSKRANPRRK